MVLFVHLLEVELKLGTLEDVAVGAAALAGARRDTGVETVRAELIFEEWVHLLGGLAGGDLLLNRLGARLEKRILLLSNLGRLLAAKRLHVMVLEPLLEGRSINLNNVVLHERVGTHNLVTSGVVYHLNDAGLLAARFRAPRKVTGVETKGAELLVATASAHFVNTLAANLCV